MGCVISHPKSSVETPLKISSKKDFAPKSKGIIISTFFKNFISDSEKRRCRLLKF